MVYGWNFMCPNSRTTKTNSGLLSILQYKSNWKNVTKTCKRSLLSDLIKQLLLKTLFTDDIMKLFTLNSVRTITFHLACYSRGMEICKTTVAANNIFQTLTRTCNHCYLLNESVGTRILKNKAITTNTNISKHISVVVTWICYFKD